MFKMLFYMMIIIGLSGTAYAKTKVKPSNKVINMGELVVKGKVQKPRVMYILNKGKIKYKGIPLKEDFLKKVEDPLLEDRF